MTAIYLLLGLALMGGLYWILMQITARQRNLNAELSRLESLVGEVAMNAEAVLDQVDERMDRLNEMLALVEARSAAAVVDSPAAEPETGSADAQTTVHPRGARRAKQDRLAKPVQETRQPDPIGRYQGLQSAIWALAEQGHDEGTIAEQVGVPRGEVQLLLNLRAKKVATQATQPKKQRKKDVAGAG